MDGAVFNIGLVSQVVGGFDGCFHPLHREEGSKVGRVGGDDDQSECPPVVSSSNNKEQPCRHTKAQKESAKMPPFSIETKMEARLLPRVSVQFRTRGMRG